MTDTEPPAVRAALLMARHSLDPGYRDADRNDACVCGGWVSGPMGPGWDDHLAEVLAEAGLLVPDTGQAREAPGRRDTAVEAAVAAWRDVQRHPFVMPGEMTELAIALDELTAAHETVSALVSRETTDDGRSRDAEPSPDTGQAPESPTDSTPKAGRWGSGEAETATGAVQAPDVAALLGRLDELERSGEHPLDQRLTVEEVHALLGTDTGQASR